MKKKGLIFVIFSVLVLAGIFLYIALNHILTLNTHKKPRLKRAGPKITIRDFSKYFDKYGIEGCFVLYDLNKKELIQHNPEECETGYLPASTFKIPNSLIALKEGVVKDRTEVFKWDGKKHPIEAWNQDQTLVTAIKYSCVWVYIKFAEQIGLEKYKRYLKEFDYGNQDLSGPANWFWLEGPFKISANQQLDFIKKFYLNQLSVPKEAIDLVKSLIVLKKTPVYTFYGKTGSGSIDPEESIMWLVGYLEKGTETYLYALNFKTDNPNQTRAARKEIVLDIFREMKLVE